MRERARNSWMKVPRKEIEKQSNRVPMLIDYKIEYKEDTVYDYIGERESNRDIGEIPLGM